MSNIMCYNNGFKELAAYRKSNYFALFPLMDSSSPKKLTQNSNVSGSGKDPK